jgi:hypothetical protein
MRARVAKALGHLGPAERSIALGKADREGLPLPDEAGTKFGPLIANRWLEICAEVPGAG